MSVKKDCGLSILKDKVVDYEVAEATSFLRLSVHVPNV